MIAGITRVRNESLILEDTLSHYLALVDWIYLYDDDSTDNTVEIARGFDRVTVIQGERWSLDRPMEETRHRKLLLDKAAGSDWVLCFDADERIDGPLPDLKAQGYRFRFFDGYMVEGSDGYTGGKLADLPRMWGPEYRDILTLFQPRFARYYGQDQREPKTYKRTTVLAESRVKHFGKCISVEQWEETCEYYATHWPEPYASKWAGRRGKAIHTESDFGAPLYPWDEVDGHGERLRC